MSVTMTKEKGVTMITITSDSKNKWPPICQLLSTMCCSPVCFVSKSMKQKLGGSLTVLGTLQILVGLMNVATGCIYRDLPTVFWDEPFWMAAVFIAAGIACILADKFPSPCLIIFTVVMNLVSAALAITSIVLYSVDLAYEPYYGDCRVPESSYGYRYYEATTTASPLEKARINKLVQICLQYKYLSMVLNKGLDILMIVLGVLALCCTISTCVLSLKTVCKKKKGDEQNEEDPELYQPLVEEDIYSPAC